MALAVPPLVGVGERVADGVVQPEPGGQAGADLAMTRQAAPLRPGVSQRPDDAAGPPGQREILAPGGARSSAGPRRAEPSAIGAIVRVEGDVVAAGQHRRLRRVRRAADEPQQGGVVHARPVASSRPSCSAAASDSQHVRRPCSIGWPVPRSVASDRAIVSSASRPDGPSSATPPVSQPHPHVPGCMRHVRHIAR